MKIIILGAGQVGAALAEHLATEHNDITVIDHDPEKLLPLQDRLDIRTLSGCASHPNLLLHAGGNDADMLIAVTNNDETNMIACQIAETLFQTPTKIARVRSLQYLAHDKLFGDRSLPIDVLISPEQLVTNYIRCFIEHPNAMQVLDFTNNKVQLVAVKASFAGILAEKNLLDAKIVAIFRNNKPIPVANKTIVQKKDEIFFLASKQNIRAIMGAFKKLDPPNKRVIIAGGGNIGTRLAFSLEKEFRVKIIEHNAKKVDQLATHLSEAVVLHGKASDKDLLVSEDIAHADVFCAVTNFDEANIMSALLAKRLGAKKVMALINREAYVDVVENVDIDVAISPHQATIGSLLTHVRRGDVVKVHSLRRGAAEAIEAIVHSDSSVVGKSIKDIPLPSGATIGAIVRGNEAIMKDYTLTIKEQDHIILFLSDKNQIPVIEGLFQSNAN